MSHALELPVYMSLNEFLIWNPDGPESWQLVNGVPRTMVPASTVHGTLLARLAQAVANHLDTQNSPWSGVVKPGVVPHLLASHNLRVPDLAVTCAEIEVRQPTLADPVLVAEILSPSNQAETWDNVLAYATIPTVQEILVLRSAYVGADLMRRRPDGSWPREAAQVKAGDLVLDSIGLRTPLMDLYRRTPLWRPPVP